MKPDPILEELWATKDRLALESGYDAHCFAEKLRKWEAEHRNLAAEAEAIRELPGEAQRKRAIPAE